jgi:peptidoglycan-N-acetylglucosamine deacetylase
MMKSRSIAIASLAGALLLIATVAAPAEPLAAAGPACWSPDALAAKVGEDRIQKGILQAFATAPKRNLAAFSPLQRHGVVRRVELPPGKKLIALTFDLCEQPYEIAGYQGGIVDYLRRSRIKATFFAGGKWMLTHRERAQQLSVDPLFEVGNHTFEHYDLRLLAGQALIDEIKGAQLAYEQVRDELEARQCTWPDRSTAATQHGSKRLALFRFPFGACDEKSLEAVANLGLTAVQWDVSSGDPAFGLSSERMVRDVLAAVHPGSIVLFHANGRGWHTQSALPAIVEGLKAQGYQFVTVSELLAAGEPVVTNVCYDGKPGDTDRYDGLARRLEVQYQAFKNAVAASRPHPPIEAPPAAIPSPPRSRHHPRPFHLLKKTTGQRSRFSKKGFRSRRHPRLFNLFKNRQRRTNNPRPIALLKKRPTVTALANRST